MQTFESLYRDYFPLVYRYLYRLCQDEQLANELTQDTFFNILQSIEQYRGDCEFSVWACQIAKNNLLLRTHIEKSSWKADKTEPIRLLAICRSRMGF